MLCANRIVVPTIRISLATQIVAIERVHSFFKFISRTQNCFTLRLSKNGILLDNYGR